MARALRIEYSGAFYHIMHRGNAGFDIFKSESDREKFLEYLGKSVVCYELKIHSYCLMAITLSLANRDTTTESESGDKMDQRKLRCVF